MNVLSSKVVVSKTVEAVRWADKKGSLETLPIGAILSDTGRRFDRGRRAILTNHEEDVELHVRAECLRPYTALDAIAERLT